METTTDDDQTLVALERAGWDALCGSGGRTFYDGVMAPVAMMVFPGMRLDRDAAVASIPETPSWDRVELHDVAVVRPAPGVAVVAYTAVAHRGGERYEAEMTTSYAWLEGAWRLVLHQQSPTVPPPA